MFTLAKQVAAANASVMPLFVAGIFYYIFNFVVAVVGHIERIANSFFQFDVVGIGLIVTDGISTVVCMAELNRLEPFREFREVL